MTMRLDIVTNDAGELVRREHARDLGKDVVQAIYRLAKLAQMHDLSNQAFVRQLEQSTAAVHDYCLRSGSNVNILFAQKAVFVAGQLLKGSRGVYDQAIELGDILDWCGGSELVIMRDVTQEEMLAFAEAISQATRTERGRFRSPSAKIRLRAVDDKARLRGLELENLPPEQRIVRAYASAVVIMRRFFDDLQASRYVLPRRIKRIAQSLVDLSEGRTAAFLGVTEVRNANHDDAGRAVNSAILAVSMAREITGDRVTLAQIAMAAMMHDVGRPRAAAVGAVPGMPQMPGVMSLSEEQEDRLAGGTAAVLTALGRVNEPSITRTVVAFESLWMRRQRWIGPLYRGARPPTLHAKIVTLARRYNDLMTPEPGLAPPTADFVIATISEELKEPSDKTVLRMLVAALGIVPVGTVVQLSTGEVCEVVPRVEPGPPDRPRLRVAVDAQGGVVSQPTEIDLAREPHRRVVRVMSVDGWRKGLDVRSKDDASMPPASAKSGSGLRSAHEPSSPSRSAVSPSRSGAQTPSQTSSRPPSPPVASLTVPLAIPPLALSVQPPARAERSSPSASNVSTSSAVSEAMGKMIDEALKSPTQASSPPVTLHTRSAPDDARTVMQTSPFDGGERVPAIHSAAPLIAPSTPEPMEPTALGSLDATPLAHVLVYMLDHTLSGSVVIAAEEGEHVVYFLNGVPAKARLAYDVYLIGEELAHMGALPADRLDELAAAARRLELLFGEFCVGHELISREVLARALELQLVRRVSALSNMPPGTGYAYYRDVNLLDEWGGGELALPGPLNTILAAVRAWEDRARIRATLNRIGKHLLMLDEHADLEDLHPSDGEHAVVEALATRQLSLPELFQLRVADEDTVSSVVYTLAVTRQFAFRGQKKGPMAARPRGAPPAPRTTSALTAPGPLAPAARAEAPLGASLDAAARAANAQYAPAGPPTDPEPPSPEPRAEALSEGIDVDIELEELESAPPAREAPSAPPPPPATPPVTPLAPPAAEPSASADVAPANDPPPSDASDAERALEAMSNFRLAETALQRGAMPQAEMLAQKAAEGDPERSDYAALLAWIRAMGASGGQVSRAIETMSGVLRREPTCERALLYRGKLLKRAGRTKDALRDFESLLKVNPKHREAASEVRLLKMHAK